MNELINELCEWLTNKRIQFKHNKDLFSIDGFGDALLFDTDKVTSIFKKVKGSDDIVFNSYEPIDELISENIFYVFIKFGLYWYYIDLRESPVLKPLQCIGTKAPTRRKNKIVNLGVHTSYELLNSSVHVEELPNYAKWYGHDAVGICDMNTMAGTYPLQKNAKGIKGVFGYSTVLEISDFKVPCKLYPKNQNGLHNLLRIQKIINVDRLDGKISIEEFAPYASDMFFIFAKDSVNNMIGQTGEFVVGSVTAIVDPDSTFYQFDISEYRTNEVDLEALKNAKTYIREVYLDDSVEFIPPVLLTDCFYLDRNDAKSRITLNKIASGGAHNQSYDHYFKDVDDHYDQMFSLFGALDGEGFSFDEFFDYICENTVYIADNCNVKFENDRMFMPVYPMTPEEVEKYGDKLTMFDTLLEDGFKRLVPAGKEDEYRDRIEREKYVLKSTNSVDYFLIYYDLCKWSRENDILMAYGRGSAGGCLASYFLGIIKIDPIKYDLIFERFLIPERSGLNEEDAVVLEKTNCDECYEVKSENGVIHLAPDSIVLVERNKEKITIPICGVIEGDVILLDNIHEIWDVK